MDSFFWLTLFSRLGPLVASGPHDRSSLGSAVGGVNILLDTCLLVITPNDEIPEFSSVRSSHFVVDKISITLAVDAVNGGSSANFSALYAESPMNLFSIGPYSS